MSTLVKEIVIPEDRCISIKLPPEVQVGEARITVKVEQKNLNHLAERFGKRPVGFLKGRILGAANVKNVGGEELIRLFEGGE